jgi:hypothetical protein
MLRKTFLTVALFVAPLIAHALPTPQDIQSQIEAGQAGTAIGELHDILQAHPDSAVAWYLMAEAQDATGQEQAARDALAKADQIAPGLPFANPSEVSALRSHLVGHAALVGIGPGLLGIVALVVLFIAIRLFMRARRPAGYAGTGPGNDGYYPNRPPYGAGGMPYGPGPMQGGSNPLISGLEEGAGFAVGERVVEDIAGGFSERRAMDPTPDFEPNVPDRDDGLQGSPDWNNDDNFDPDNNW